MVELALLLQPPLLPWLDPGPVPRHADWLEYVKTPHTESELAALRDALFGRLAGLCNDVGLLSEEYDPQARRLVGNFPQAFSHVGLVNTALNLHRRVGPAKQRCES
jgi:hypothetical protein